MNNLFLFVGFLFIFLVVYRINKNSLTSPSVVFTGGFLVSSFFFLLSTPNWNYIVSTDTVYFLLTGNVCFLLGCSLHKTKIYRVSNYNMTFSTTQADIPNSVFCVMLLIELIGIWLRFRVLISILGSASLDNMALGQLRSEHVSSIYDIPLKIVFPAISAIVLYSIIIFFQRNKYGKGISIRSIVLMIGYSIFCALSSSRIDVLCLFIFFIVFYVIIKKNDSSKNISFVFLSKIILVAGVAFLFFYLLGFLTGKSQKQDSFIDNICMYAGASIGAFDAYCSSFRYSEENMFVTTFQGVKILFSYLGVKIDIKEDLDFGVNYVLLGNANHGTNVYTCYYNLVHDFNKLGALVIIFLQGYVYQLIYSKAKKDLLRNQYVWFIFYVSIVPYVFFSSIADRFFDTFLTITSLIYFIYLKIFHQQRWI